MCVTKKPEKVKMTAPKKERKGAMRNSLSSKYMPRNAVKKIKIYDKLKAVTKSNNLYSTKFCKFKVPVSFSAKTGKPLPIFSDQCGI